MTQRTSTLEQNFADSRKDRLTDRRENNLCDKQKIGPPAAADEIAVAPVGSSPGVPAFAVSSVARCACPEASFVW